jgi:hypothetical protein
MATLNCKESGTGEVNNPFKELYTPGCHQVGARKMKGLSALEETIQSQPAGGGF